MRPQTRSSLVAALVVGTALPLATATGAGAADEAAFAGYTATASAAPVTVEIYEPTIPIPATPQAELAIGYTTTEGASGLLKGRASWLWPGDPVGEGFKTFGEAFGLPPQLYENGYPVQVNSNHPNGPEEERDEPFPGAMMRTSAGADRVAAVVGYSPDGQPSEQGDRDAGEGGGDGDGGGTPGLPELPAIPGLPSAQGAGTDFGAAITGQAAADEPEEEPEPEPAPGLPPELAMLVDFSGITSQSSVEPTDEVVRSESSAAVGEARLLGGVVTLEGLSAHAVTTSNGAKSEAKAVSRAGSITIAGQTFGIGSDGIKAGGQDAEIPGLPDDPERALAQLGISLTMPSKDLEAKGLAATGVAEALVVELDVSTLKQNLDQVPLGDVIGAVPDEAGQLKDLLSAAANLAPRIVITLGNASADTETVQGIDPPVIDPPTEEPGDDEGDQPTATGGSSGTGASSGTSTGAGASGTGAAGASASGSAPTDGALGDTALASGLPALNTIPGALTMGGILLAVAAGTWLRRIGMLALGGAGSCAHGLDSGLPDLRKA